MKRLLTLFIALIPVMGMTAQEKEITTSAAKSLYKNTTKKRVSVHDPSVVWEPTSKRYYIFGSHRGMAFTTNMQNWTSTSFKWKTASSNDAANKDAFTKPQVTKVKKNGAEVDLPAFNAVEWSARTDANYNVDGNMWAPDVIYNPTMKKWCMYLSINGDAWHSSIILLTADKITGPYQYQGPVVICGFYDTSHSYKDTDLELVIGEQASLPSRYNVGNKWGNRWPHTIDPAVFYDENDKLWLVYGSWSGGIWMLELDEETGLRDYDVDYPSTNGSSDGVTSDPYYGKKIGGGYYVSGEGPYIEHIGNYYYLFVSYGFYSPNGGYEMRVFRSEKPDGPYKDASNRSAIFSSYVKNYGAGTDNRGEKLMGAYGNWGFMSTGECAQGHNSIIAAEDGKTYLVYHTKFNDGNPDAGFHSVRVHQVFQNKNGWLVASPFEYNDGTTTDADIASKELVEKAEIPGTYHLLVHKYKMDYEKMEEVTPVSITLSEDGKVSGSYTGTWSVEEGTSYLTLKLGSITYQGVLIEEQMDEKSIKTIAFTAMTNNGVNVWGYKYRSDYSLAWQINNQKVPVSNNQEIVRNVDLYAMNLNLDNVSLVWKSSVPEVISDYGKYYPKGLKEDTPVTLTARLTAGNWFWQQDYTVKALSEANSQTNTTTWKDGMLAHYQFDNESLANNLNAEEKAQLASNGTTKVPTIEYGDKLRNGGMVHLNYGANGKESYVSIPNPLKGKELTDGATISFFVKRTNANLWDALLGMKSGTARLFLTGNLYTGFNDGKTANTENGVYNNWVDINNPNTVTTNDLGVNIWHQLTITFQRTATSSTGGVIIYVDGVKHSDKYNGSLNGKTITTKQSFDYNLIVDHLAACDIIYLGNGSFWGSADALFDEVVVYDRPLSLSEITALYQMLNRSDEQGITEGIDSPHSSSISPITSPFYFDLQGRRIQNPGKGLYINNGKKIFVK